MIGHSVKSGQFFYYMCGNGRRRGRGVCASPLLPKARIEGFVIDRIKRYILTEENLAEVVRLTNEELAQVSSAERERVKVLEAQMREADGRLAKLYDALETGQFGSGELAPRIKSLFQKREDLARAKAESIGALEQHAIPMADANVVREYVADLRRVLENSGMVERKAFLKSFVEGIEVESSEVTVHYSIPVSPDNQDPTSEAVGVLPFVHDGPPSLP